MLGINTEVWNAVVCEPGTCAGLLC